MKQIITCCLIAMGLNLGACQSNTKKETANEKQETACMGDCTKCEKTTATKTIAITENPGVYYFHGDRKCKTCKAVGKKAKEVAEKMNVQFFDINLDQDENKAIAKEFQASGSSLYIKHNKSGKIEDLTTFAFRTALNDSQAYVEKLKATLKSEL